MSDGHFIISNPVHSPSTSASSLALTSGAVLSKPEIAEAKATLDMLSPRDGQILTQYGFMAKLERLGRQELQERLNPSAPGSQKTITDPSKIPSCLYNIPQADLAGSVLSFESSWGAGLSIGYNSTTTMSTPAAGKIDFSQSRLELGLSTLDPLKGTALVIADGVSYQSNTKVSVDLVPGIPVGISFFLNTSMSSVIRSALDKALAAIVTQYKTSKSTNNNWNDVWESRVIYDTDIADNDVLVGFRGGEYAGIKQGDTFTVTNYKYEFKGAECYTELNYKVPLTATPIAILEAVQVGDYVTVAKVKQYLIDQRIMPGAIVKIQDLVKVTASSTGSSSSSLPTSTAAISDSTSVSEPVWTNNN
jgi:hypothetical protein